MLLCDVAFTFLQQEAEAVSLPLESGLALVTCPINRLLYKSHFGAL